MTPVTFKELEETKKSRKAKRPVTSLSKESNFPFPFVDPPQIPHIDAYVQNDNLKTYNLARSSNSQSRKENDTNLISFSQPFFRNSFVQNFDADDDDSIAGKAQYDNDTRGVIKFIRLCGNPTVDYITLRDLESALRKCKRHPNIDVNEGNNKVQSLLRNLGDYFDICHMSPAQWFAASIRTPQGHFDKTLTWYDFKYGIRNLYRQVGVEPMADEDVLCILKYFDPNNQGFVTLVEFSDYFMREHMTHPQKVAMQNASPHMLHILELTHNRQMRIRDLFHSLDPDHNGRVSVALLASAIHKMFQDDDSQSQAQSIRGSISSSLSRTRSVTSRTENGDLRLPFIGGTDSTNKMFIERLAETKHKLDDSNFSSDPKVMSPMISSKQRSFRMSQTPSLVKPPFEVEEPHLVRPSMVMSGISQKHNSDDTSSTIPEEDGNGIHSSNDSFAHHSEAPSSDYSQPLTRNALEKKSVKFSVLKSVAGSVGSNSQHSRAAMRNVNPARYANHMAAVKTQVEEESKGYDAWVDQFDKKVELYLKRLHRI